MITCTHILPNYQTVFIIPEGRLTLHIPSNLEGVRYWLLSLTSKEAAVSECEYKPQQ